MKQRALKRSPNSRFGSVTISPRSRRAISPSRWIMCTLSLEGHTRPVMLRLQMFGRDALLFY
eukprot:6209461-Pleurochrysis_carterae.AAC.1